MRPVCALLLVLSVACKEESEPLPPPGEGPVSVASGGGPTLGGGAGSATSGSGEGGVPLPDMPASCGCVASAGAAGCRACLDATAGEACADAAAGCEQLGQGYCALVFDCIGLCPTPDIYCVDTCLGAKDSARAVVEAYVACACGGCAAECGEGACG